MILRRGMSGVLSCLLAAVLGGCSVPLSRTADVAQMRVPAGGVAAGASKLLIVPVLQAEPVESATDTSVGGVLEVVATTSEEREFLTSRLGDPHGASIEVGTPGSLGSTLTGPEAAAWARAHGARWMLVTSVDTHPAALSSLAFPSLLLLGLTPFDVGGRGEAQAALLDLTTGERLASWSFEDSGWQVANLWTMSAANHQIAERANHRMLRRIGRAGAEHMAQLDSAFKESVAAAKVRIDGWGE